MSDVGETNSHTGFDTIDHQPAYIYTPSGTNDDALERPTKRRKVARGRPSVLQPHDSINSLVFEPLLGEIETLECVQQRQDLFEKCWSETDARIQSILNEANEDTLAEVTAFVDSPGDINQDDDERVPASFIVTGPNIASQDLLFKQLSARLKKEINGPIVTLRSGDASNMKAVLKQLIRDATNQRSEDEELSQERNGRKLLNYDLDILQSYVKKHGSQRVVVAFQDSEAFDTNLVVDLVILFSSWMDRIPFTLLFGIATSVELFQERLSRAASRCLYGFRFDVEQTSSILERIFQSAVANSKASLRLGSEIVASLMERQHDHVQSVQSFIVALKYAYMCHFYGNALSILTDPSTSSQLLLKLMKPCHFEAIRMLPSFRKLIELRVESQELDRARELIQDDAILVQEIEGALESKDGNILRLLRAFHVFASALSEPPSGIDLYMTIFEGALSNSDYLKRALDSIKRMTPNDLVVFIQRIKGAIENGSHELDLDGWADEDEGLIRELRDVEMKAVGLSENSADIEKSIRSSDAIHSKGLRTTVIAQRVQLSYEKSTITEAEKEFINLIDHVSKLLEQYFALENPKDLFLNELWLCDSADSFLDVFAPRPRAAIENALSAPYEYLTCEIGGSEEGLSSTHPPTAIIYQSYLEAGSLINMADLWTTFHEILSSKEGDEGDEREALMQFYRALADLKLVGMVKQSKKKADHLAKVAWKGL
ncbi:Origin recognition complex subunit [Lachnellula subtilissima]|uniref:Origin recognition complex subunit 3 n=1 Tax=Lachnellula subtilissima TaxID=602034 RepID=A0A8H8U6Q0_9HELO|nr:Origin recognition complex subunit [Lachnellula subtilissima]